jgi:hypothetical protein
MISVRFNEQTTSGIIGVSKVALTFLHLIICRASWIRDSSFTLYALIRLGFTHEANGAFFVRPGVHDVDGLHSSIHGLHTRAFEAQES